MRKKLKVICLSLLFIPVMTLFAAGETEPAERLTRVHVGTMVGGDIRIESTGGVEYLLWREDGVVHQTSPQSVMMLPIGSEITLTAIPAEDYEFSFTGWYRPSPRSLLSAENSWTFEVGEQAMEIGAQFVTELIPLYVSSENEGSILIQKNEFETLIPPLGYIRTFVAEETEVKLTALPNEGDEFSHFIQRTSVIDLVREGDRFSFTVQRISPHGIVLEGVFQPIGGFFVTAGLTGGGSVRFNHAGDLATISQGSDTRRVPATGAVDLFAMADDGYVFSHWEISRVINGVKETTISTHTFIWEEVLFNMELTAVFLPASVLYVETEAGGRVRVANDFNNFTQTVFSPGWPQNFNLPIGTQVTLTAEPANENYFFVGWYVDGGRISGIPELNLELKEGIHVIARFESRGLLQLSLQLLNRTGGTVILEAEGVRIELSPEGPGFETVWLPEGTLVSLIALPQEGWELTQWRNHVESFSTASQFTFYMTDRMNFVIAEFQPEGGFELAMTAGIGGNLTAEMPQGGILARALSGTRSAFQLPLDSFFFVTPDFNTGFSFNNWIVNGNTFLFPSDRLMISLNQNFDVQLTPRAVGAIVEIRSGLNGAVSFGTQSVGEGEIYHASFPSGNQAAFTAAANEGYVFKGWFNGQDEQIGDEKSYVLTVPERGGAAVDKVVEARFVPYESTAPAITGLEARAVVTRLAGSQNKLEITVIETHSTGEVRYLTDSFYINNNGSGTFAVDSYHVFVNTQGNTQIREIFIIE